MGREIVWTHLAEEGLHHAFLELLERTESIELTERIIREVFESTYILESQPEIYQLDRLKIHNSGNIRAYIKHGYRLSYLIDTETVYILRVRHASSEPLEY